MKKTKIASLIVLALLSLNTQAGSVEKENNGNHYGENNGKNYGKIKEMSMKF